MKELDQIANRINSFVEDRNWAQFHSPKNLSMALSAEAGELLEIFQWLTEQQSTSLSTDQMINVRRELADILIYMIRLANVLEIDLLRAVDEKISENEHKYPSEKVRGSAKKYTEY